MTAGLEKYIYEEIVPQYAGFDSAHKEDHALTVIAQAKKLAEEMGPWKAAQELGSINTCSEEYRARM